MAEITFKSPGVSSREIDLSFPSRTQPAGVPAGVIGTANEGPAFVPITVSNFSDYQSLFGVTDGKSFGPIAVSQWLQNANSCTYVRVLGVGDGKKRAATGVVTNAGFVVGDQLPLGDRSVNANPYAVSGGPSGRVHFLGCFMSESAGSTFFSSANLQQDRTAGTAASIVNAIDTTSVGSDTKFSIVIPPSMGGEGIATVIFLDASETDGNTARGTNTIGIGINGETDAAIASDIIDAINNTANDKVTQANGGAGQTGVQGITASQGSSDTQITLTMNAVGSQGNATNAVVSVTTGDHLIVDGTDFTGGEDGDHAIPIIRGVLFTPDRVIASIDDSALSGSADISAETPLINDTTGRTRAGHITGSVNLSDSSFTILLGGHINNSAYPNIISASFDITSPKYFAKVLNKDPTKLLQAGHVLYSHYDIHNNLAVVTGSSVTLGRALGTETANASKIIDEAGVKESIAFMLTSSLARAGTATSTLPDFEDFRDRFSHAVTPFITSQSPKEDLFRFHALSAGSTPSTRFKIAIENLTRKSDSVYGSFDVVIRDFNDTDEDKVVLESFRGINLDPNSNRFIGRAIGDINVFYEFDKQPIDQRINVTGDFPVRSKYVRVEIKDAVKAGSTSKVKMPFGFRAPLALNTSGTLCSEPGLNLRVSGKEVLKHASQPPIPYRQNITLGTGTSKRVDSRLYWGPQYSQVNSVSSPNSPALFDETFKSIVKFFPTHRVGVANFVSSDNTRVIDEFNLENIKVVTGSGTDSKADSDMWLSASYIRGGASLDNDAKTRGFEVRDLETVANRRYAKFTVFLQGGFDGVNIFDTEKSNFTNNAALNEVLDTTQGGVNGPTVAAYKKAIDVMGSKADADIQVLAVPGIREPVVTNHAITTVENRFDAIYLMDVQEYDNAGNLITGSIGNINVTNTATSFKSRALDSSFAAAYFPDVYLEDPTTKTKLFVPPSVAALGAYSLNDAVAHPWFAPAGFTRGSLKDVEAAAVKLSRKNLDDLYENKINPITSFPGTGLVIFGQKTLLEAASSLDRVNVRRLLINVRRAVRNVANSLLFEPNRAETLERFNALVNPILQRVQEKGGVDRFRVVIDTTTTTQADIENNTIRGKIFLQPTRTIEFIALDFVVTNAGAEI